MLFTIHFLFERILSSSTFSEFLDFSATPAIPAKCQKIIVCNPLL